MDTQDECAIERKYTSRNIERLSELQDYLVQEVPKCDIGQAQLDNNPMEYPWVNQRGDSYSRVDYHKFLDVIDAKRRFGNLFAADNRYPVFSYGANMNRDTLATKIDSGNFVHYQATVWGLNLNLVWQPTRRGYLPYSVTPAFPGCVYGTVSWLTREQIARLTATEVGYTLTCSPLEGRVIIGSFKRRHVDFDLPESEPILFYTSSKPSICAIDSRLAATPADLVLDQYNGWVKALGEHDPDALSELLAEDESNDDSAGERFIEFAQRYYREHPDLVDNTITISFLHGRRDVIGE